MSETSQFLKLVSVMASSIDNGVFISSEHLGAKLLNSLLEHIKTAESVNKFQILIEKHIV